MRPGRRRRLECLEDARGCILRLVAVADAAAAERVLRISAEGERLLVVITGVPRSAGDEHLDRAG